MAFLRIQQIAADDFDLIPNQTDDVCRIDFDGAAVYHHIDGMLKCLPDVIWFVHVFFGELGGRAQNGLVEMLEKFLEERVRRHSHTDFGALHVQAAGNMRVSRQNKGVRPGHARLHDVESEVIDAGVIGGLANVGNDERHEEFFHGLLEGVKLVDCLGRFGVTANRVTRFSGVENKTVVFQGGSGKLNDSRLRIYWVYFKTHGDKIVKT